MKKAAKDIFNIPGSKIMYDNQGNPEYVLVPIQEQPVYQITEEEIVDAVREVRQELSHQTDAQANQSTR